MLDAPITDALLSALLNGDKAALDAIQTHRAAECASIRTIICTDASGAVDLDLGLSVSSSDYMTSFFEGPRAFFMSAGASVQARLTGGRSNVLIDFSLSFDSNFAEKLRAAIAGENIQQADRDRVLEILMLKARNRHVQFDVMPFLIENTRLARKEPSNERPLNTLIAFRMLDHLDWDTFQNDPGRFVFSASSEDLKAQLRPDAKAFLAELQASAEISHQEAKSAGTQALLLRFARLWHEERKPNRNRILRELIRFSIHKLRAIPLTEIRLIWSGMTSNQGSPFFGPIMGRSPDMVQKIRGMAWDMTLLRVMEQIATASQVGSFFIPYFVSMDRRWRHLLRLNPVRLMVIDDAHRRVIFARTNELEFQRVLGECTQTEFQSEMTPEKIEARRMSAQAIKLDAMQELVIEEERHWHAASAE
ncbi:hypothetical protein [Ottowia oryzae]|uniref:Uncharacterized protein n=1 Tax=Ottowia oryzae TaxID=2109914 RepID=A0A2S0MFW5_9BURK|nr:hypothetical protein [Ottowia oryzae]AVO34784.1 hypothetical protein C6570_11500 [Ottowia oryzae]